MGLVIIQHGSLHIQKPIRLIKEGLNELTSKLTCISNPHNMTKYYSVNVTGVSPTQSGGNDIAPSLVPTPSGYFDDEENSIQNIIDSTDLK